MMPAMSTLALLSTVVMAEAAAADECGHAVPLCMSGAAMYGFGFEDPESQSAAACCAAAAAWRSAGAQAWELMTFAKHAPECKIYSNFSIASRSGMPCTSGKLSAAAGAAKTVDTVGARAAGGGGLAGALLYLDYKMPGFNLRLVQLDIAANTTTPLLSLGHGEAFFAQVSAVGPCRTAANTVHVRQQLRLGHPVLRGILLTHPLLSDSNTYYRKRGSAAERQYREWQPLRGPVVSHTKQQPGVCPDVDGQRCVLRHHTIQAQAGDDELAGLGRNSRDTSAILHLHD